MKKVLLRFIYVLRYECGLCVGNARACEAPERFELDRY